MDCCIHIHQCVCMTCKGDNFVFLRISHCGLRLFQLLPSFFLSLHISHSFLVFLSPFLSQNSSCLPSRFFFPWKTLKLCNLFLSGARSVFFIIKYLGCNISSNMNCCQELKQRIAMAKEAFNRKRSIFCGPLEKELRKRLVKCFVWSVVLYGCMACN